MPGIDTPDLRSHIEFFVDTGTPERSVWWQIKEHIDGNGWSDIPELISCHLTEQEVAEEIQNMVQDGTLMRTTPPNFVALVYSEFIAGDNWLRLRKAGS